MMEQLTIQLAAVNMHKCNAITHALLNTSTNIHILLIQEPWYDTIGTARKDSSKEGVDVLGGVSSPGWDILYPGISGTQQPKMMAYMRKPDRSKRNQPCFTIGPWSDICTHPCVQVLDVWIKNENWQVINFYHDVQDKTALPALLGLNIDATTPTLVIGDFNTHSPTWLPPNIPRSTWAAKVEEWASTNLLTLANDPGVITRRGADHERDSTIDKA